MLTAGSYGKYLVEECVESYATGFSLSASRYCARRTFRTGGGGWFQLCICNGSGSFGDWIYGCVIKVMCANRIVIGRLGDNAPFFNASGCETGGGGFNLRC